MRPTLRAWVWGIVSSGLVACGGAPTLPDDHDSVYAMAIEASLDNDAEVAAVASHRFVQGASEDEPRYDRALRLLAVSAEELGLSYAASLWFLEIAQARRDVELASEAVRGLERIVADYPYDAHTLVAGYLATEEITGMAPAQQAFVDYLQGLDSLRRGLDAWAVTRFSRIPERSPYYVRSRYVLAVKRLSGGDLEGASAELEDLLESRELTEELGVEIRRALARIAFDQGRYDEALEAFDSIRATAPDDPNLLLELAWTHYYLGSSRRALGMLVALDAPAYQELIAPERFLLEALALRRLCQFEPARRAAVRLHERHGDAIDDLYNGVPLLESKALRAAAGLRTSGHSIASFVARMQRERKLVDELAGEFGPELHAELVRIYTRGIDEAQRRADEVLGAEMERAAQELLDAEEGVRLILHELGVALLRGRRRPEGVVELDYLQTLDESSTVLYRFDGEFWTDELDDLVVTIEDRCID